MPVWRAQPIFISSTFEDFQAERDHLRNFVFPALEERLRTRKRHLEWVDLRIGVSVSRHAPERREQEILKVCLDEVKRCRPFMLVLIGDRYGTIPKADRLQAAIAEAGVSLESMECSVTELEIRAGAFAAPDARAVFYFREPLDYRRMKRKTAARYSNSHGRDRLQRAGETLVTTLKQRILERFPTRVHRYRAGWDKKREAVVGLEAWGREVADDLWRELAVADDADDAGLSPFDIERRALEEFAEDRARDFIGREEALAQLIDCATRQSGKVGIGVTGAPGSGKTAVFSAMLRRLAEKDITVLAHAAGASPRARSINLMLRRWIAELNDPAPDENASDTQIESTFARALARVSQDRRVAVVIDALDQFEPTARGRHFSWTPTAWPANSCLIVTGVPGEAMEACLARKGMQRMQLAGLGAGDARKIVEAISARYHRVLEPEVVEAMLGQKGAAGESGATNPLWLVLASEEINLVDADDIARAKQRYRGSAAEQLRAMLVDVARALPGDVTGLYKAGFKRAADLFGAAYANAFIGMIAISRGGWRESDFRIVMPKLSGQVWDELRFAALRRLFRGQMLQRGIGQQWDFAHAQMRVAALAGFDGAARTRLHGAIADHLLALPPNDPLRVSEAMVHLLASEDWSRAAHLAADLGEPPEAVAAGSQTLIEAILAAPEIEGSHSLPRVTQIMDTPNLRDRYRAAQRFQYEVLDRIANREALDLPRRLRLHEKVRDVFRAFGGPVEGDIRWYSHVCAADGRIGEDYHAMGNLAAAEPLYQSAVRTGLELARIDPEYAEWNRDCSVAYNKLGRLYRDKGDSRAASATFQAGLEQLEIALRKEPTHPEWLRDLAVSKGLLGDAQMHSGDANFHKSLAEAEAINTARAKDAPDDIARRIDLAHDHDARVGRMLLAGNLREAQQAARDALSIYENAARLDPKDSRIRRSLARAWRRLGDTLDLSDSHHEAVEATRVAAVEAAKLADSDPSNTEWAGDASAIGIALAKRLAGAGNLQESGDVLRAAEARLEALVARFGQRPIWLEYGAQAKTCAAVLAEARGDLDRATAALEAAVEIHRAVAVLEGGREPKGLGESLGLLGALQWRRRDMPAAERALIEAVEIIDRRTRANPRDVDGAQLAATCLGMLGEIRGAQTAHGEALEFFASARERLVVATAAAPQVTAVRKNLAVATSNLSYAYSRLGRPGEAQRWQREAIALIAPLAAKGGTAAAQMATWTAQLFDIENRIAAPDDPVEHEARCLQAIRRVEALHGALPASQPVRMELIGLYEALRAIQAQRGDLEGAQVSFQAIRRLRV